MAEVNLKLTPGEILIAAGALVTFIFSFLHFYTTPSLTAPTVHLPGGGTVGGGTVSGSVNAWASFLVPTVTLIVLFTLVMGLQVVLHKLADVDAGPGLAGFSWPQIHLALGFFAVVDAFAYLIVGKGYYSVGVGLIFMLIGSAACFAGAVLLTNERRGSKA